MGNAAFMRTKEAKQINRTITKEMQELKKATDPKYYLNTDAVMQDINSAFTSNTASASQAKNSHLKMRAKAMRAQKEDTSMKELGPIMEDSDKQATEDVNKKHEDIKKKAALMASKKRRQLGKQSVLQESMMSSTTKGATSQEPTTEDISDTVS